jgi:GNAT superfamily N-acetyltransferase
MRRATVVAERRLLLELLFRKPLMQFRRATALDITAMHKVRVAVVENALSNRARITPQMYEDYLDRIGRGWVCEIDSQIVGFSFAAKADHSIWALFVFPEYEGRGVGRALLKLATNWLFEIGANRVVLTTEANTRADRFYATRQWVRGEMRNDIEVHYTLQRDCGNHVL